MKRIVISFLLMGLAFAMQAQNSGETNGHEWVDLGLSVKWATCNVGASYPTDIGYYFAWGEVTSKGASGKAEYSWSTYMLRKSGSTGDDVTFKKYNSEPETGTVDNKNRLDLADDAANKSWGDAWRMPTMEEINELKKNCTFEWKDRGIQVVSKINGNSIIFPIAGKWEGKLPNTVGQYGYYWSSELDLDDVYHAFSLNFAMAPMRPGGTGFWGSKMTRYLGLPIRPVIK